jgi:outer membrane protein
MNRLTRIAVAVAFLFVAVRAHAGEAPAPSAQPIRIAYVDLDRVASDSQMVRSRVSDVEKQLAEKQKDLKSKMAELKDLNSRLVQQESVLPPAQSAQIKEQIRKLRDDVDRLQYDSDKILNNTSRDIIEPVLDQVLAAVERVAKAYQIDLVMRGDLVLFASERVDLTDAIIRELDRAAAATAGPVTPAGTPARRSATPDEGKKLSPGAKPAVTPPPLRSKAPRTEDGISK